MAARASTRPPCAMQPRFVTEACTLCGACAEACPAERADEFNYGLCRTKAAYLPHGVAYPALYAIDRAACPDGCRACDEACTYGAIRLDAQPETRNYSVSAIVAATGWKPYDATRLAAAGLRQIPQRGDERHAGAHGGVGRAHRRAHPAALRWQRAAHGGVRAVRRVARRKPPALLFGGLLRRLHQAGRLHPRALPGNRHHHFLYRYPHARQAGGVLQPRQRDANLRLVRGKVAQVEENAGHRRSAGDRRRYSCRPQEHPAFRAGGAGYRHGAANRGPARGAGARRVRIPMRTKWQNGPLRRRLRAPSGRGLGYRAGCHRRGLESAAVRQPERVPCQ